MSLNTWLIYVAAVLVLTVTPGPTVLSVISISVNRGWRQAILAAFGSIAAVMCMMALSALGLGALLAASEKLFSLLKWAGAAYLAFLGISSLIATRASLKFSGDDGVPVTSVRQRQSFLQGFLVGASNPKALVFFTALFPQFIDASRPQGLQFLVLGATFVFFELFWLSIYAALGAHAKHWLQEPGRALMFNRATGGVFLLAATVLASAKRSPA